MCSFYRLAESSVAAALLFRAALASAQSNPFPVAELPDGLRPVVERTPPIAIDRLDSSLAFAIDAQRGARRSRGETEPSVQVEVCLRPDQSVAAADELGDIAEISGRRAGGAILQAWIAVEDLERAARIDGVEWIRRPERARPSGIPGEGGSRSEGSPFFDVERWHDANFRGTGVAVGIIDVGFEGYRELLGDELPLDVAARNFVDRESEHDLDGDLPHGTAVAEIVHDVAPDARLAFARADTLADFQDAVLWLLDEQHVDVISTSISFLNVTPGDGTGMLADLVQLAVDRGVFWATAAGNSRESHWGGAFFDPDDDDRLDFPGGEINFGGPGTGGTFLIHPGFTFRVFVRWDDWTLVDQGYDVVLFRWDGRSWREQSANGGRDRQRGAAGQTPTEAASVVTTGDSAPYGFQIRRIRADRPANFEILTLLELSPTSFVWVPLDSRLAARSLHNLADAPAAVTVGAIEAIEPFVQQEFSSEGPTNGPGGTAVGGTVKPDIAAYDGVSTATYGPRGFFGTSAATPHVAAAAALVLSAHPGWTPEQVRDFLEDRALDLGPLGRDNRYGEGRLALGAPPTPTPTATGTRTPTQTRTSTPTHTRTQTPTPGHCYGDCNRNGRIEVNEIILGVRIALGLDPIGHCPAHDGDANGQVEIDELVRAVGAVLFRCVGEI